MMATRAANSGKRVTVAVCTCNRPDQLRHTLERMTHLWIPESLDWELLVVNNDGSAATDAAVAGFAGRLPIHSVHEPWPGLGHARNRAVDVARGDYIVWTDDDVLVDEQWLAAYCAAFERWPDAAVFGGPIAPRFEGEPPVWVERALHRLSGPFVIRDLGPDAIPLGARGTLPYGANYAVRTDEQRRHRYDTALGRRAGQLGLGHEETDVLGRMFNHGSAGWWVPDARVEHCIPAKRQTFRYVRAYLTAEGEYLALRSPKPHKASQLFFRALRAEARFQIRRHLREPERWIDDLFVASELWGRLRSTWRQPAVELLSARNGVVY